MLRRLRNRLQYALERWVVRGASQRLLLIAAGIGLISVLGGAAVLWAGTGFEDFGEAVWWAFLRLSDPGYLGDDVGAVNRTVSTVITVAGYVVFLGALVAVMTQWLNARMERLESGLTPVARDDHVLVLGWTNRTDAVVEELLLSEARVRRFLRRHGARELHVVVMAPQVNAALLQDLRDAVGEAWDERRVTLRSGSPIRTEHLARVDHRNASAILVPATEFAGAGSAAGDVRTVKTLLSLAGESDGAGSAGSSGDGGDSGPPGTGGDGGDGELPLVVAEVFDVRKVAVARRAYPGPLEVVASDAVVSRLLAQNVRHPGLSYVYNQLLSHGRGCELYVRTAPELSGRSLDGMAPAFPDGLLMGVVRPEGGGFTPHLNPQPGLVARVDDRYVVLAAGWEEAAPRGEPTDPYAPRAGPRATADARGHRSILLLGWNQRVPALLREFGTYADQGYDVHVLSTVPVSRRERALERHGIDPETLSVRHSEGDYAEPLDLAAADPARHDAVVMVGSDRLRSEEESDARTIVGALLLEEMLPPGEGPGVVMELLDPENVPLVDRGRGEVLISPLVVSHMLAQVALRRELRVVYEELFTAGGAEITFRPLGGYGFDGAARPSFGEVRRAAHAAGETALGFRSGPDVTLGPGDDERPPGGAEVVTMVTYA